MEARGLKGGRPSAARQRHAANGLRPAPDEIYRGSVCLGADLTISGFLVSCVDELLKRNVRLMQTGFPSDSPTFRERVRIRPSPETESKGLPSLISQKLTKRCLSYVSPRYKSACCGLARQIFHRELRGRAAERADTAAIEQAF